MLRAGFIGAGGRSQGAHYPCVNRLDNVEMVAVCELDETRLNQVVDTYNFPHVFTDHKEMLAQVELDVVYCIMHEKWILQPALDCLNVGKHIMIEKPPGKNSDETRQLLDAAIANDVYAMVAFQRRYATAVQEAMRRVKEKGPVSLATTTFNKKMLYDKPEFTTTLWNDLVHVVDLLRFMVDSEPIEVTRYRDKFDAVDWNHYTAMVRFQNNATGVVFGNRASGGRVLRAELHGVGIGCYMKLPEEIDIRDDNEQILMNTWEINGDDKEDEPRYEGVLAMHEHFVDCVINGKVPCSDLRDAIHSIDLVDCIENGTQLGE
jgi:predicted dehydrogenase